MFRKAISVSIVFLGTFGIFYSANIGDYGWTLLCGGLVILGALILKKSAR
ncbi:MAG: hypothetical protein IKN37_01735 [Bacteroidales bacterium]|jgi:hypothetical protein|nr:hypothetical protein [Bacteroidales bacterium]MBR4339687.1 hypothetical protein [Bacteroidales bacterium]MBR4491864.1 hypothetical protein [Bacteroidales bacterium]MBR4512650.1 hypothetical protein [Bacteroidales bacterium]MBR6919034.1 hypothetical protein [Bacteroidales bacterium]